ncbi:hypothetical protein GS982_01765 [Rhodococcus hoagii]|uniref:Uncharacterized protein n=1 Tax=Rhodococcus hoagii TaxID=43767 RepID=A0A9Q5EW83_RHOHA|nr:hypothetical protein [Prescottella equi]NKT77325.1 hypothetical protein [Prescottella equi]NKZ81112.1 hypothetical protein [Prescottella equi]
MARPKNQPPEPWELQAWAEDYKFLIEQGLSRRDIAKRLGMSLKLIENRCRDLKLWHPESRYRGIDDRLQQLIERGLPFSVVDFSLRFDANDVALLLKAAAGIGMLREVGRRSLVTGSNPSAQTPVYEPA